MKIFQVIHFFDRRTAFFYCLAGGLSAVAYFLLFSILWQEFHINYKISISIAYIISILVHFTMNRKVTFQHHEKNIHRQLPKYSAMVLINYLITMLVVHIIVIDFNLSPYFGVIFGIGLTVLSGYLMSKYWVFKMETAQ